MQKKQQQDQSQIKWISGFMWNINAIDKLCGNIELSDYKRRCAQSHVFEVHQLRRHFRG